MLEYLITSSGTGKRTKALYNGKQDDEEKHDEDGKSPGMWTGGGGRGLQIMGIRT